MSLAHDLRNNDRNVVFFAPDVALAALAGSLRKWRVVTPVFPKFVSFVSHALSNAFRVVKLKLVLLILLSFDARVETALDVMVKQVVKETICSHHDKVLAWRHLMLVVEGSVGQLAACSTLVREVESVLLLLRAERFLQKNLLAFTKLSCVDHIA